MKAPLLHTGTTTLTIPRFSVDFYIIPDSIYDTGLGERRMAKVTETNGDRAIALTLRSQAANNPKEPFVRSEVKAFGGTVITVTFKTGENRLVDNFVFFDGRDDHIFFNAGELFRYFDSRKPNDTLSRILFVDTDRAPAIIALVITLTICYLAITSRTPPDILGHALTTILGFYFGSKVSDSLKRAREKD
jgi:hypothetical protein